MNNPWWFLGIAFLLFVLSFFTPMGIGLILVPVSTYLVGFVVGRYHLPLRPGEKKPPGRGERFKN